MILDEIAVRRREQLAAEKERISFGEIKRRAEIISSPCRGFGRAIKNGEGISVIAEVKKASPSKGLICADFQPVKIAAEYEKAGAAAISCLTEEHYFMGSSAYLSEIHEKTSLPVLRKDFVIDPYQIYEARVIGADAILLIAALLDRDTLKEYCKIAHSVGLDVLGESHNESEAYDILDSGCGIVGINNRDLKTFDVSLRTTEKIIKMIPEDRVRVSESGIASNEDMRFLRGLGADAVLIGETLMRSGNIGESMKMLTAGV